MSDPRQHHYLPVFYLKQWAGEDGRVHRFSRPFDNTIVTKHVSAKSTAYEEHLYSMTAEGVDPNTQMERSFMSSLDSEAARVLSFWVKTGPSTNGHLRIGARGRGSFGLR